MSTADPTNSLLDIRLFGPMAVTLPHRASTPSLSRKARWLLALLTLRHDREVERCWLAATLWPDNTESQALDYLRHCLTGLRQALGDQAPRLRSPQLHTLRLDLEGASTDVIAFDACAGRDDPASLERAVALYRGPLLEGCSEEWVHLERNQREQSYLTALERLAAHAIRSGDPGAAVGYLKHVVEVDAPRESAHRSLMEALAARGNYAAVSNVYRDLRVHLHAELNGEPAAETAALFTRLRRQGRDRAQAPPTRSAPPNPPPQRRLPRPLTELIGREQEVTEIVGRLGVDHLVTLTGPGGVGKTRLALQVAHELADDYPDGVWFVELAGLGDPALVVQTVHGQLEVMEQPNRSVLQTLLDFLKSRQALLVLDNCEHLVSACADLVQAVLQTCPHVRVLATSRQSLGLSGEVVWRVPALEVPTEGRLDRIEKDASSLLEYPGVQLFVERARQAAPQFRVSGQNAMAVAQVCARLEGLPLATELAAARVGVMTPAEMLTQWDRHRDFLVSRKRDASPRHRTLQAAIAWSYHLLSADQQRFFVRLSVFRGGWTAEAAEQVCAPRASLFPSLDMLDQLLDASLIQVEQRAGVTRFWILETLREFGWEQMTEGERAVICRRHLDYFLALAEEAEPKLHGPEQAEWFQTLEEEHENLRAALDWSIAKESSSLGLRLCGALWRFWWIREHISEGREWCVRALGLAGTQERAKERAKVLNAAGILAYRQGDYASARMYFEDSLAIRREIGDRSDVADSLNNLGSVPLVQGDYASAQDYYEKSLAIRREIGNRGALPSRLHGWGMWPCIRATMPPRGAIMKIAWPSAERSETGRALRTHLATWGLWPPIRATMRPRGAIM